ncbi:MAG: hypothetical protein HFP77_00570, partial [Methylococcales symbiont of Iophon sp. n. MRB-2018]
AKDGGNAVRLSGTISADRQGWWKCSKIVWNNLCPRTRTTQNYGCCFFKGWLSSGAWNAPYGSESLVFSL